MCDRTNLLDRMLLEEGECAEPDQHRAVEPVVVQYHHGSEGSQYALASGRGIAAAVGEHWGPFPGMDRRLRPGHSWVVDLAD